MKTKHDRMLLKLSMVSTILLAVSFFLPFTLNITYLKPDGTPAGILGQWFHSPDADRITSYGYIRGDINRVIPVIFFLPLVLTGLEFIIRRTLVNRILIFSEQVTGLLVVLSVFAIVATADFSIFPETVKKAYGGYVALAAGVVFFITALIRTVRLLKQVRNK